MVIRLSGIEQQNVDGTALRGDKIRRDAHRFGLKGRLK